MAFLEKWRLKLAKASLQRQMKKAKHEVKAINLYQAKEVGILFNATTTDKYEPVRSFIVYLHELGLNTHLLGYINSTKIPESYLLRRSFHFFSKKELTWIYKPVNQYAIDFCKKPLDILFYLDTEDLFPLRYLASVAKASFKVGMYFPDNQHLDFMICLKEDTSINYLIEQIKIYLTNLKTMDQHDHNKPITIET